jgi:hypothetical protein
VKTVIHKTKIGKEKIATCGIKIWNTDIAQKVKEKKHAY